MTETTIGREQARRILAAIGEVYDPFGDYYVRSEDGVETLRMWGVDEPLATNRGTSWLSPGI